MLDGHSGDCASRANLMARAMMMLGVPASAGCVYASEDGSNILQMAPSQSCQAPGFEGRPSWLVMNFQSNGWNAYEGFCTAAGNYYTLAPDLTKASTLALYQALPFTQGWVVTPDDVQPGDSLWLPVDWDSGLKRPGTITKATGTVGE